MIECVLIVCGVSEDCGMTDGGGKAWRKQLVLGAGGNVKTKLLNWPVEKPNSVIGRRSGNA